MRARGLGGGEAGERAAGGGGEAEARERRGGGGDEDGPSRRRGWREHHLRRLTTLDAPSPSVRALPLRRRRMYMKHDAGCTHAILATSHDAA